MTRSLSLLIAAALLEACGGVEYGIGPSNTPPTAAFTVECNELDCILDNGSTDPDGTIVAYEWDFGDNTARGTTRHTAHSYPVPGGRFVVTLAVTDNDGAIGTATEELDLSVPNLPPTAGFTFSCTGRSCVFTDQSHDNDFGGSVAAYAWDFGDGRTSSAENPAHLYAAAGNYTVALTVTDNLGRKGSISKPVLVDPPPGAPAAAFSVACAALRCAFADESTDDGAIRAWHWEFGDGGTSSQKSPVHQYSVPGDHAVRLTVTDDVGETGSIVDLVTVTVLEGPTAAFAAACSDNSCTFTDLSTTDDVIAVWNWDFGDGGTSSERNPIHVYDVSEPTTFTVTLTVWDTSINGSLASQIISVAPPGGDPWFPW